jgi:hypothetical protein
MVLFSVLQSTEGMMQFTEIKVHLRSYFSIFLVVSTISELEF